MANKKRINFSLSEQARKDIADIQAEYHIPATAVIELAVRAFKQNPNSAFQPLTTKEDKMVYSTSP